MKHAHERATLVQCLVRYYWASPAIARGVILGGRVAVGDHVVRNPETVIHPGKEEVTVNGHPLLSAESEPITIVLHKPKHVSGSEEPLSHHIFEGALGNERWFAPCGVLPQTASGVTILTQDREQAAVEHASLARLTADFWLKVNRRPTESELSDCRTMLVDKMMLDTADVIVSVASPEARHPWMVFTGARYTLKAITGVMSPLHIEPLSIERRRLGPFSTSNHNAGSWYRVTGDQYAALNAGIDAGIDDATPLENVWEQIATDARKHESQ